VARTLGQLAPAGDAELAADAGEVVAHPGEAVELKVALSEDDAGEDAGVQVQAGLGIGLFRYVQDPAAGVPAAESASTELPSTRQWVSSQAARHRRAALMLDRRYG